MVVKVYISGISGNKEVKKRQQRVLMILDSKTIKYSVVDITEPGQEAEKDFMQNNSTSKGSTIGDANPRHPLPPQIFNESEYCGDYDQFDTANEIDTLEQFLKLEPGEITQVSAVDLESEKVNMVENHENGTTNGEIKSQESMEEESMPKDTTETPEKVESHDNVEEEVVQAQDEVVDDEAEEEAASDEEEKSD